jgi:hypothetical protein
MRSIAIVDSGPLIAAANRSDKYHFAAASALRSSAFRLVIPALCVAEAGHILAASCGSRVEASFLRGLTGLDVRLPEVDDWSRIAELVEKYSDLPLSGTDASVVTLAERLETDLVLTTDHRHFRVVRPRHCDAFRLLPEQIP